MKALANSLKRIWSAKSRIPHRTGWGTRGSALDASTDTTLASVYEVTLALTEFARRTTPTILLIVWNIFR